MQKDIDMNNPATPAIDGADQHPSPAHATSEYLTFRLGAEEYGIDILRVQEIRSYEPPTRIANSPAFIKGVVNLRGVIVPIIDLRLKLNCDSAEYNHFTVIIVLKVRGRMVGAVVDSVSTDLITDIGSMAERKLILMDIEALISSDYMELVESSIPNTRRLWICTTVHAYWDYIKEGTVFFGRIVFFLLLICAICLVIKTPVASLFLTLASLVFVLSIIACICFINLARAFGPSNPPLLEMPKNDKE